MTEIDLALSVALGVALAAASGFRVFVPLLVMSAAANWGYVSPGAGFDWLATLPALLMLAVAAAIEVVAFYVPDLDNLLDALAAPAAVIAGIVVAAAAMTDVSPMLKWTLAIIAGGGAAAMTQGATTFVRAHSTMLTAGLGNAAVATGELAGATVLSIVALAAPLIALALTALLALAAFRLFRRRGKGGPDDTGGRPSPR
ncbi:DUF4126 domain-containing protein [Aestuariivirga sp.]|uniref:DUF4126 domain-containing protein n=1 Tax=Aestuariivirga sp. TaxID=2650926 RepID=UPI003593D33D